MGGSRNQHWAVVEKKDLGGTHHLMSGLEYASAKGISFSAWTAKECESTYAKEKLSTF